MPHIAVLGLGRMGSGMAARLLATGHTVTVYNRTAARAEPLVRAGARLARTPRDAANGAEAVISMAADDAASRAFWLGADGALAADLAPGVFVVEWAARARGGGRGRAAAAAAEGRRDGD